MPIATPTLDALITRLTADAERGAAIISEITALKANQKPDVPVPDPTDDPVEEPDPPLDRPTFGARTVYDSGAVSQGKAYLIPTGAAVEITSVEGARMAVNDHNGAIIRQECDALTVRDLYGHDGECCILSNETESLDIAWSRSENVGENRGSGIAHPFYTHNRKVRADRVVSYRPRRQAHCFKARECKDGVFENSIFAMLDGWGSRCFDLTDGGNIKFRRAIFQVGPNWDKANDDMTGWGREVLSLPTDSYTIDEHIYVNDHPTRKAYILSANGAGTVKVQRITLIGGFDPANLFKPINGSKVQYDLSEAQITHHKTRAEAGWPAYNGAEMCIPWNAAWGPRPGLWDEDKLSSGTPVFNRLSAPETVPLNGSATISWDVANAHMVMIGDEGYPAKGSITFGPLSAQITVTLKAISRDEIVARTVTIAVGASAKLDLSNLKPYWNEIPDSAVAKVFPTQYPPCAVPGYTLKGTSGPLGVVILWSGGAMLGRKFVLALAGGHNGYQGNEPYEFDLDTQEWVRARDPDAIVGITDGSIFIMADGNPPTRHTYAGVAGIDSINKVFIGPGFSGPTGNNGGGCVLYDPATKSYETLPFTDMKKSVWYDAKRDLLWSCNGLKLIARNPHTWETVVDRNIGLNMVQYWWSCGDYDPDAQTYVFFGPGTVTMFDLSDLANIKERGWSMQQKYQPQQGWQTKYPVVPTPIGDDAIVGALHGVAYRPASKAMVCWDGGPDVIVFDHLNLKATRIATPPGPMPGPRNSRGVFGRWRYVKELDAFLGFDNAAGNVMLYRLPA